MFTLILLTLFVSLEGADPHRTENTLRIFLKNKTSSQLFIDYLGGDGDVETSGQLVPVTGEAYGYVVGPNTEAKAIFHAHNPYSAHLTIHGSVQNHIVHLIDTTFEYNNGGWMAQNLGSAEGIHLSLDQNAATIAIEDN